MGSSSSEEEVGPTKDTILALLDFLVDPLLPSKSYSTQTVSSSQEELVAKQMHAVVLLYNYHHRKQHPSLPFLEFQAFCKLAMDLKQCLKLYFGVMQKTDYAKLDDPNKQLSLTEKAIMNACDTSKILYESDKQIIEGWPINKVAVLLVDSQKENCYLLHGSITQGVWSVIEREVDVRSQGSESAPTKKNRVIRRAPKENQTVDAATLLQIAYSAIKESCGIDECDLNILEYHSVYSTSKAKTAARLFIMQCTQTNHDEEMIPIKDVMDSLQGPLVRKEAVSWVFTPVVEYFHLLPFADKVSNWLMRDTTAIEAGSSDSSHTRVEIENCIASQLVQESLNSYEKNCANSLLKKGSSLNTSEATEELRNGNSCHAREESVVIAPKYCETLEARNDNSSHLKKPPLYTSQQSVAVEETSEAAEGIRNDNNHLLTNASLQYASQLFEAPENVNSINMNDKPHPCTLQYPEVEKEVKKSSTRRFERTEPVVYRKRNRSQKKSSSCNNLVSKTTKAPEDCLRVQEEKQEKVSSCNNPVSKTTKAPEDCLRVQEGKQEKGSSFNNPVSKTTKAPEDFLRVKEEKQEKSSSCNNPVSKTTKAPEECLGVQEEKEEKGSSCNNPVSKTTKAPKDYLRMQEEQCMETASSNNVDIVNGGVQPYEDRHHKQELMIIHQEMDHVASTEGAIVVEEFPITSTEKISSDNKISDTAMSDRDEKQDCAIVPLDSNIEHVRKIQLTIDSKEKLISQTALKNLFRKKEQLTLQLRSIADELSLCDRSIQTILTGGEDDFAVKIDSILEGCNELCLRTGAVGDKTALQIQDHQELPQPLKRRKLSEADLCVHNPCQELDGICNENFWMLPIYSLSTSEGGFQAVVTVKEVDFECSSEGTICATPVEARKSAALKILTKLRSMAAES